MAAISLPISPVVTLSDAIRVNGWWTTATEPTADHLAGLFFAEVASGNRPATEQAIAYCRTKWETPMLAMMACVTGS